MHQTRHQLHQVDLLPSQSKLTIVLNHHAVGLLILDFWYSLMNIAVDIND